MLFQLFISRVLFSFCKFNFQIHFVTFWLRNLTRHFPHPCSDGEDCPHSSTPQVICDKIACASQRASSPKAECTYYAVPSAQQVLHLVSFRAHWQTLQATSKNVHKLTSSQEGANLLLQSLWRSATSGTWEGQAENCLNQDSKIWD